MTKFLLGRLFNERNGVKALFGHVFRKKILKRLFEKQKKKNLLTFKNRL